MSNDGYNLPPRKTLWTYFREGLRKANANRPVSFYLLLSIPVVLLLGTQIANYREAPKQATLCLGLLFVFFMVILWRALVDFIEIARRHFSDNEKVFRTTLGDSEFITRLGERVEAEREK